MIIYPARIPTEVVSLNHLAGHCIFRNLSPAQRSEKDVYRLGWSRRTPGTCVMLAAIVRWEKRGANLAMLTWLTLGRRVVLRKEMRKACCQGNTPASHRAMVRCVQKWALNMNDADHAEKKAKDDSKVAVHSIAWKVRLRSASVQSYVFTPPLTKLRLPFLSTPHPLHPPPLDPIIAARRHPARCCHWIPCVRV